MDGHLAFALEHTDGHGRLVIGSRRECLLFLDGDGGISFDQGRQDSAFGFDSEGQRGDVQEQNVFSFAREDTALDSRTDCDDFVGIDPLVRFLAEDFFDQFADFGDAG